MTMNGKIRYNAPPLVDNFIKLIYDFIGPVLSLFSPN